MNRKYFKRIFKLEARIFTNIDQKKRIDYAALGRIFNMVGYVPEEKQKAEFRQLFQQHGGTLKFEEFLTVFSLKPLPQFSEVDVKNAFRLLS